MRQDGRQRERVEPQGKADREAGARGQRVAIGAEGGEDEVRGELRHRGKGDEADRRKRRLRRDEQRPGKREQDDADNRQPPDAQHRAPDRPRTPVIAAAHKRGENQIVRNHGGKRGRIDDHHRRRRADPAQQREHQRPVLPRHGGQLQHIEIGGGAAFEQRRPGQRDGKHHQRHRADIGGKAQPGADEIVGRARLDQPHVELARQHQHRHCRDEEDRADIERKPVGAEIMLEHGHAARILRRVRLKDGEHRQRGHHHKRCDLDDRFEPDGIEQPFAAPREFEPARAEKDGEEREQQRRGDHRGHRHGLPRDDRDRAADRTELERDIGNRAAQRDHRDEAGDHHVMAKARRDEIGNGLGLFLRHGMAEAAQETGGGDEHADRREIDRQIVPAVAHRAAHGTVKGPAAAIDAECQRIGAVPHPPPARGAAAPRLDRPGEREQGEHQRQHDKGRPLQAHR